MPEPLNGGHSASTASSGRPDLLQRLVDETSDRGLERWQLRDCLASLPNRMVRAGASLPGSSMRMAPPSAVRFRSTSSQRASSDRHRWRRSRTVASWSRGSRLAKRRTPAVETPIIRIGTLRAQVSMPPGLAEARCTSTTFNGSFTNQGTASATALKNGGYIVTWDSRRTGAALASAPSVSTQAATWFTATE